MFGNESATSRAELVIDVQVELPFRHGIRLPIPGATMSEASGITRASSVARLPTLGTSPIPVGRVGGQKEHGARCEDAEHLPLLRLPLVRVLDRVVLPSSRSIPAARARGRDAHEAVDEPQPEAAEEMRERSSAASSQCAQTTSRRRVGARPRNIPDVSSESRVVRGGAACAPECRRAGQRRPPPLAREGSLVAIGASTDCTRATAYGGWLSWAFASGSHMSAPHAFAVIGTSLPKPSQLRTPVFKARRTTQSAACRHRSANVTCRS